MTRDCPYKQYVFLWGPWPLKSNGSFLQTTIEFLSVGVTPHYFSEVVTHICYPWGLCFASLGSFWSHCGTLGKRIRVLWSPLRLLLGSCMEKFKHLLVQTAPQCLNLLVGDRWKVERGAPIMEVAMVCARQRQPSDLQLDSFSFAPRWNFLHFDVDRDRCQRCCSWLLWFIVYDAAAWVFRSYWIWNWGGRVW